MPSQNISWRFPALVIAIGLIGISAGLDSPVARLGITALAVALASSVIGYSAHQLARR